jgi:hypothetical protein
MIFGFNENPRYPDEKPVPVTTLINPWLEVLTDETEEGWEGCLSVPGMRGSVPRATHIRYGGTQEDGGVLTREARGFHARVFQHEFDHLNGILYPQRIKDMTRFGFIEALFPKSELAALERDGRARRPFASQASTTKSALSPPRQRISSSRHWLRPMPGTGNGVEGRALTRQRVTAAVGCPNSAASVCRRQRRMAMPMAPDPSAAS